ncbi:MAG: hypothetical protein M0Z79_04385 [Nitrospiraceae bacterium]|nr:hypothetical protein [Nitrospiraceae bacterium]
MAPSGSEKIDIIVRGINKAKIFDIDIVAMLAVVSGIQYFAIDREEYGKEIISGTLILDEH